MDNTPSNHFVSDEADVEAFILLLRGVLQAPGFNPKIDLDILYKKSKESPTDPYTTQNTLLSLDFDSEDVYQELLSLEKCNYLETVKDDKDPARPPFYVFIKNITHKDIYIKVKIRDFENHKVFCVSFHFARYAVKVLPYAK